MTRPLERGALGACGSIVGSLGEWVVDGSPRARTFRGAMSFGPELTGPPGRVHGGVHPVVRTLPILARLRGPGALLDPIRIDASVQQALPLDTDVPFDGTYSEDAVGFLLRTRFAESERLVATARALRADDLPDREALERLRAVAERAASEEALSLPIMGVPYRASASAVALDPEAARVLDPDSRWLRAVRDDGAVRLTALAILLDSVGAMARGVPLRHPHFTKHITLAFDLEALSHGTEIRLFADRTTIVEDPTSSPVDVNGALVYGARVEVVAVDASFSRCFAHGWVHAHPIDPARYAAFGRMRDLRDGFRDR